MTVETSERRLLRRVGIPAFGVVIACATAQFGATGVIAGLSVMALGGMLLEALHHDR